MVKFTLPYFFFYKPCPFEAYKDRHDGVSHIRYSYDNNAFTRYSDVSFGYVKDSPLSDSYVSEYLVSDSHVSDSHVTDSLVIHVRASHIGNSNVF